MNKKEWLDYLFYKIGNQQYDFFVCGLRLLPNGEIKATKWKKYSEICFPLDPWEDWKIKWVNQRQILPIEIVLDLEKKEQLKPTIEILRKLRINFNTFFTGSRGYHIHLFFKDNTTKQKQDSILFSFFGADIQKGSNKTMIALEFTPHWKTGRIKEEIEPWKLKKMIAIN